MIEVLLTLAVVASISLPLFMTQYHMLDMIHYASNAIHRIFLMQATFEQAPLHRNAKKELSSFELRPSELSSFEQGSKELGSEGEATKIAYTVSPIPPHSMISRFHDLSLIRVRSTWSVDGTAQHEDMISFAYNPQSQAQTVTL